MYNHIAANLEAVRARIAAAAARAGRDSGSVTLVAEADEAYFSTGEPWDADR